MQTLPLGPANAPCTHALSAATDTMHSYACGTALARADRDCTTVIWLEYSRTLVSVIPNTIMYTIVPGLGPIELNVATCVGDIETHYRGNACPYASWLRDCADGDTRLYIAATSTNLPAHLRDKYTAGLCDVNGFLRHPRYGSDEIMVWVITHGNDVIRQRIIRVAANRDTTVPASVVAHENTLTVVRYGNDAIGQVAHIRKYNIRHGTVDNVTIPLCTSGKEIPGGSPGVYANPDGDIVAHMAAPARTDTNTDAHVPAGAYTAVTENNVGLVRRYDEYRRLRMYMRTGMSIRDMCNQRSHDEIVLLTGASREFVAHVNADTGAITYESRARV